MAWVNVPFLSTLSRSLRLYHSQNRSWQCHGHIQTFEVLISAVVFFAFVVVALVAVPLTLSLLLLMTLKVSSLSLPLSFHLQLAAKF